MPREVIIVDQSDGEETAKLVRRFQGEYPGIISYLRTSRIGKSHGLNIAVQEAQANIVCFTDDDCVVPPDWLEKIDTEMKRFEAACVTGKVLPRDKGGKDDYLNLVLADEYKMASRRTNPWKLGCSGCNMAIRKEVFQKIGYFDESLGPGALFKSALDGDIVYRLLKGGLRVLYSPMLRVYHAGWRGPRDLDELRHAYALGLGAFAAKYLRQGDLYPFLMISHKFLLKLRRLILGIILFQRVRLRDGYLHLVGLLQGFFQGLLGSR